MSIGSYSIIRRTRELQNYTKKAFFLHLNTHFLLLFDDSWGASASAYPEFYHSGIKYFNRFVLKTMGVIEKMLNTLISPEPH